MIKVSSKYEAWKVVDGYLGETKLDEKASERAGYEIYKNDKGEWVSDLGSRFEINLTYGGVVNVWFDDGETKPGTKSVTVYYRGLNDIVCSKKIKGVKNIAFYNKPDQVAVWTDISKSTFFTDKLVSIQYDD
jgi:hypothetical protein